MRRYGFDLAAVVSACHNPYRDNGIKFFGPDGTKIDDEHEASLEQLVDDEHAGAAVHPAACASCTAPAATTCASSSRASRTST